MDVFTRRDTMELWRSARDENERPESEELAEELRRHRAQADLDPPPSYDVLSAQLQSLVVAYRKLTSRDRDAFETEKKIPPSLKGRRPDTGGCRTAPPKRKLVAGSASNRLLATTASRAAAHRQRPKQQQQHDPPPKPRRLPTPRRKPPASDKPPANDPPLPPPPPETDIPPETSNNIQISRPPRRAMNPFPQLSPFLPENQRSPAKTPVPGRVQKETKKPATAPPPPTSLARDFAKAAHAATALASQSAVDKRRDATAPSKQQFRRPKKTQQVEANHHAKTVPVRRPTPAATFGAQQENNPFNEILSKGISPALSGGASRGRTASLGPHAPKKKKK